MNSSSASWNSRRGPKEMASMRRQRSLEWRERGYSSSEEEIPTRPVDSHVFASLLAQAQQEYSNLCSLFQVFEADSIGTTDSARS